MKLIFYRGIVVFPKPYNMNYGGFQTFGYSTDLVGHHLYLGKNCWLLPNGRITCTQTFHRMMIHQYKSGYWESV